MCLLYSQSCKKQTSASATSTEVTKAIDLGEQNETEEEDSDGECENDSNESRSEDEENGSEDEDESDDNFEDGLTATEDEEGKDESEEDTSKIYSESESSESESSESESSDVDSECEHEISAHGDIKRAYLRINRQNLQLEHLFNQQTELINYQQISMVRQNIVIRELLGMIKELTGEKLKRGI